MREMIYNIPENILMSIQETQNKKMLKNESGIFKDALKITGKSEEDSPITSYDSKVSNKSSLKKKAFL